MVQIDEDAIVTGVVSGLITVVIIAATAWVVRRCKATPLWFWVGLFAAIILYASLISVGVSFGLQMQSFASIILLIALNQLLSQPVSTLIIARFGAAESNHRLL